MATLNITYNGLSADYPLELDPGTVDRDIKRIAVEIVRSGNARGLHLPHLADDAFEHFVVDRLQNGLRIYLRPKVPFGASRQ
jgi:hypothetical protein